MTTDPALAERIERLGIMTITDGGYYCATCERRLMECRCAPAERLWEAGR